MRSRSRSPVRESRHHDNDGRGEYSSSSGRRREEKERVRDREQPLKRRSSRERPTRDARRENYSREDRHIEREDRGRERERGRERDYTSDRHRRDRDRNYEAPVSSSSSSRRRTKRASRSRSRSPKHRHASPNEDASQIVAPQLLAERPEVDEKDLEGKSQDEQEMMRMMGFGGFETTKNKSVDGNDISAVNILQKRKYRQYMNRKGGFNRPLDFVA